MFRRKQDEEDPFAALKDAAERGSTRVTSGNAEATASTGHSDGESGGKVTSSQVTGVPGSSRPRRRSNAFLVLLTIVVSFGGAAALVLMSEGDMPGGDGSAASGDGPVVSGDDSGGDGDSSPGTTTKAPPPKHYDLVQPAGFKGALGAVQRKLKSGERVWLIRVARDRININTRLPNGDQRLINVDDELHADATTAGSAGDRAGIPLGRIDVQAPSRAVRRVAAKGGVAPRRLDYLVLFSSSFPGDAPTWSLFFRSGSQTNTQWIASLDGRSVHRPGEASDSGSGSSSNSVTIRTDDGTTTLTGDQAQRVMACVRKAGSDGAKIQECLP